MIDSIPETVSDTLALWRQSISNQSLDKALDKFTTIKTFSADILVAIYPELLITIHDLVALCLKKLNAPKNIEMAEYLYYEITHGIKKLDFEKLDVETRINFYCLAAKQLTDATYLKQAVPFYTAALWLIERQPSPWSDTLVSLQLKIHEQLTTLEIEQWFYLLKNYWQTSPPILANNQFLNSLKLQLAGLSTLGDGLAFLAQTDTKYLSFLNELYQPFLPLLKLAKQELDGLLSCAKQQENEALHAFSVLVNETLLPITTQLTHHGQWEIAHQFCQLVTHHYLQYGDNIQAFNTMDVVNIANQADKKMVKPLKPYQPFWNVQRTQLKQARLNWQENEYQACVCLLISNAMNRLIQPLTMPQLIPWCLVAGGSMGRKEIAPYSDLDIAILVQNIIPENQSYFEVIIELLVFQQMLWLEPWQWKHLDIPIMPVDIHQTSLEKFSQKVSLGLQIDSGDLKYLKNSATISLIETPARLAENVVKYLNQNTYYQEKILAHGLLSLVPLFSNDKIGTLIHQYHTCLQQQLEKKIESNNNQAQELLHQRLGKQLLQSAFDDWQRAKATWDKCSVTDLKQRYFAPLQRTCLAMSIFFNLKDKNTSTLLTQTQAILSALHEQLNPIWCRELEKAINILHLMRIQYQIKRGAQPDEVDFIEKENTQKNLNPAALKKSWRVELEKKDALWLTEILPTIELPLFKTLATISNQIDFQPIKIRLSNPVSFQFEQCLLQDELDDFNQIIMTTYVHQLVHAKTTEEIFYDLWGKIQKLDWRYSFIKNLEKAFQAQPDIYPLSKQQSLLSALKDNPLANGARLNRQAEQQAWRVLLQEITEPYDASKAEIYQKSNRVLVQWYDGKQRFERLLKNQYQNQLLKADGSFDESKNVSPHSRRDVLALKALSSDKLVAFAKAYPELPGIQISVDLLMQRIAGFGHIGTLLIFKSLANPAQVYPVWLSKPAGITLQQLAEEKKLDEIDQKIDSYYFTLTFLSELIIHLEDNKKDNVAAEMFIENVYRYISFDADHAYVNALILQDGIEKVNVKSISLESSAMKKPLDPRAVKDFLALDPHTVLKEWLAELTTWNEIYTKDKNAICKKTDLQRWSKEKNKLIDWLFKTEKTFSFVPIAFIPGCSVTLYERWQRLRQVLKEPLTNHFDAWRWMEPRCAHYYETAFEEHTHLADRFDHLPTNYEVKKIIQSAATVQHMSLFNVRTRLQESLKAPNKPSSANLPEAIATDNYYDPTEALQDLGNIHHYFTHIKQLQQYYLKGQIDVPKSLSVNSNSTQTEILFWQFATTHGLHHTREIVINSMQSIPDFFVTIEDSNQQTIEVKARQLKLLNHLIGTPFRRLILKNWQALTDDLLTKLLKHTPDLKELDVSYCVQLTDKIIPIIAKSCLMLEKLYLNGLPQVKNIKPSNPKMPIIFNQLKYLEIKAHQLESLALAKPECVMEKVITGNIIYNEKFIFDDVVNGINTQKLDLRNHRFSNSGKINDFASLETLKKRAGNNLPCLFCINFLNYQDFYNLAKLIALSNIAIVHIDIGIGHHYMNKDIFDILAAAVIRNKTLFYFNISPYDIFKLKKGVATAMKYIDKIQNHINEHLENFLNSYGNCPICVDRYGLPSNKKELKDVMFKYNIQMSGEWDILVYRKKSSFLFYHHLITPWKFFSPADEGALDKYVNQENLNFIDLSLFCIEDYHAPTVVKIIKQNPQLQAIDLRANELTNEGGKIIFDAIKNNYSILSLKIRGNYLTENLYNLFDVYLFRNQSIKKVTTKKQKFSLDSDVFTIEHANLLGQLPELILSKRYIEDTTGSVIAHMLKDNQNIVSLDLSENKLSNTFMENLIISLQSNKKIRRINLCQNKINSDILYDLSKALKENPDFEWIDLSDNPIKFFPSLDKRIIFNNKEISSTTEKNLPESTSFIPDPTFFQPLPNPKNEIETKNEGKMEQPDHVEDETKFSFQ